MFEAPSRNDVMFVTAVRLGNQKRQMTRLFVQSQKGGFHASARCDVDGCLDRIPD